MNFKFVTRILSIEKLYPWRLFSRTIVLVLSSLTLLFADFSGLTSIDGVNRAQTVFQFLTLPTSSYSLSSGGITLSGYEISSGSVANSPATTAYATSYMFSVTHLEWLMGLRNEYIGALFPLLDRGTIGLYTKFFSYGKFENARDINEYPTDPKLFDFNCGLSYAREIVPNILSAGLSLSYIYSNMDGDIANALNGSFDIFTKPIKYLSANIFARNFGTPVKYNQTEELQPLQFGASVKFEPLTFNKTAPDKVGFSIKVGAEKESDSPIKGAASLTFLPIKQLRFSTGYEFTKGNTDYQNGISAGLGLNIKQYGVDGGWKYQSADFGSVWAVTVKYNTVEIVPKTAKDYYEIALRYFNKRRFRNSIIYAKKALRLNSNMWRAHSLISMSISAMERAKGSEIGIIFTGNIRGHLAPDNSGTTICGGLSRVASVVNSEKSNFKYKLTLEAGNLILSSISQKKLKVVDNFLKTAAYDVGIAGSSEIRYQKRNSENPIYNSMKKLVSFSPAIASNSDLEIRYIGKYKVAISAIYLRKGDKNNNKIMLEAQKLFQSLKAQHSSLKVLSVDGDWQIIKKVEETIKGIDIIIASSIDEPLQKPVKIGKTVVVSTGNGGKYVGSIAVSFDSRKNIRNINSKLLQVNKSIPPVSRLASAIRKITITDKIRDKHIDNEYLRKNIADGVFPFVSTRNGPPQAFIKIIKKHLEFPLSDNFDTLLNYDISFGLGKFITVTKNRERSYLQISDLTGQNSKEIPFVGNISEAKFSQDNRWIYFCGETSNGKTDIFRISVDFQPNEEAISLLSWRKSNEGQVTFSHDSKNILFTSTRSGKKQIYIAGADGSTPIRLTDDNYSSSRSAKFSPLDKYIAYISDKNNFNGQTDLWVIDRSNGKNYRITTLANVNSFMWLDDKGTILYSAGKNVSDLNTINILTAENKKFIISNNPKEFSEKDPRPFFFDDQKRVLFTKEFLDGRTEIFMVNTNGTNSIKIVSNQGSNYLLKD